MTISTGQPSRAEKLKHELEEFAIIALYLYVCFGAIVLYKTALLRTHGIDFVPLGFAVIKALIVGKFILLGQAFHVAERRRGRPLVYHLAYRVAVFVALVVALLVLEEIAVALIHRKPIAEAFSKLADGGWTVLLTEVLLLCLILVPYFGLGAISDALGPGRLRRIFFGDSRH